MKRVFSLIMICLLCLSMFSIFTPKAKATDTDLVSLPGGCKFPDPSNTVLDTTRLLISISVNGQGQATTVSPGETVSATCTYQIYSGFGNPSEINQGFFILSWTPSWPSSSGYYIPIWNGISGVYPGVTNTASFTFIAPSTSGIYYLYWCGAAEYSMGDAVSKFNQPLVSPAHAKIMVGSARAYLTDIVQLTTNPYDDRGAGWSPDSSTIAYSAFADSWYRHIWIMNSDGINKQQLTFGNVVDDAPAFSPDGTQIVFMRYGLRGIDGSDLMVLNVIDKSITQLTFTGLHRGEPRWSHDGQRLAFYYGGAGTPTWEIHIMNADGTNEVAVVSSTSPEAAMNPSWSPDDTKLVYTMDDGIWTVNTSPPYQTTLIFPTSSPTMYAVYSPDGEYIMYASGVYGQLQDLYLIDIYGNFIAQLTHDTKFGYIFDWSPDGQYIAFDSISSGNYDVWRARIVTDSARAVTLIVPDDYPTIQAAVDAASVGDTIFVRSGTYYESQIVVSRTLRLVGEDKLSTIVDGGSSDFDMRISADNVYVSGFTLQNSYGYGVVLSHSSHSTITGNIMAAGNGGNGIALFDHSDYNVISGNDVTRGLIGVFLRYSCQYNTISGNEIIQCGSSSTLSGGIGFMDGSDYNSIYHNNFIDNIWQVHSNLPTNVWDDGYPSGGNFWSNYNGVDTFSGAYQNEAGSDGIGDTPFNTLPGFTGSEVADHYPLMVPWSAGARALSVPYLSQGDVNWCLPTSVAMICEFFGKSVHQADVASGLAMYHSGWSWPPSYPDRVKNYVETLGLRSEAHSNSDWNRGNLQVMLNNGCPILLSTRDESPVGIPSHYDFFHSTVVTGFNPGTDMLWINDPSGALVGTLQGWWIDEHGTMHELSTYTHMPYIQVPVKFSDLEEYFAHRHRTVDSWIGISGNPNPSSGLLNVIGGDATNYKTVSISHNRYQPWDDSISVFWSGVDLSATNGLSWTSGRVLGPNDYLAVSTPAGGSFDFHPPIVNPTDTVRDFQFEITFSKSGVVVGTSGKRAIPNVGSCSMVNSPISRELPLRIGDVLTESGDYVISLRLYDSGNILIDKLDLPLIKYRTRSLGSSIHSPANLLITDPLGRSVGFDPATNNTVNGIPDAFYSGPYTEPQEVCIPEPIDGTYSITLVGTATGNYTLTIEYVNATQTITQSFNGTIAPQETKYYSTLLSSTGQMTDISWEYVFKDTKRGTMLKISTDDKYFQFTAPGKDFGVEQDQNMIVQKSVVIIFYSDSKMSLMGAAIFLKGLSLCTCYAFDRQTKKLYSLITMTYSR